LSKTVANAELPPIISEKFEIQDLASKDFKINEELALKLLEILSTVFILKLKKELPAQDFF
jgi:hypothetical protein